MVKVIFNKEERKLLKSVGFKVRLYRVGMESEVYELMHQDIQNQRD